MSEDSNSNVVFYVLAALAVLVAAVGCLGVLAAIAIPEFNQTIAESKAREAEVMVESTADAIEDHYHRAGSLPGLGTTLQTTDRPPADGEKYEVRRDHLSNRQREVWKQLNWPATGAQMYFQYVYRAEETDRGQRALVVARADLEKGGPVHTVRTTVTLEDDVVTATPIEVENELE